MHKIIAGVMGPGEAATGKEINTAFELGKLIAQQGWILLTGGRKYGVMNAAGQGAGTAGGTVVGILPDSDTEEMSDSVDIPIVTGMLDARNSINILSSHVLFFVGMNPGTASELALALKYKKPAVLISQDEDIVRAFQSMSDGNLNTSEEVVSAIKIACSVLEKEGHSERGFSD